MQLQAPSRRAPFVAGAARGIGAATAFCSSKAALPVLTRGVAHERRAWGGRLRPAAPTGQHATQECIRGCGMNEISRVPTEQLTRPERSADLVAGIADARPADLAGQDRLPTTNNCWRVQP